MPTGECALVCWPKLELLDRGEAGYCKGDMDSFEMRMKTPCHAFIHLKLI